MSAVFQPVRFIQRRFDNHANQWNFGVDNIETEWVLSLDADYCLTQDFINELHELPEQKDLVAYYASFKYCIFGRPLRATLYPPRAVLFSKAALHLR